MFHAIMHGVLHKICKISLFLNRNAIEKTCTCGVYTPSYKRDVSQEEKSQPIFKYIGKRHKRNKRIHVCGLTVTGALGVLKLPLPENKLRMRPKFAQCYPYPLPIDDISMASCGYGYSIFANRYTDTIKVYGCGVNTESQIGIHKNRLKLSKKMAGENVNKSFHYLMEPSPIPLPMKDPNQTRVIDVSCGRAHTLILTDTDGVYSMGSNAYGQCGRPIIHGEIYENNARIHRIPHEHFPSPVIKVVCGMDHSLFLTKNGEVFGCGWGADGQTGLESFEATGEPTQLKGDLDGAKVTQITSFADTSIALSENNDVFGWGSSEYGQLGCITDSTQALSPTRLPFTKQGKITQVAVGGSACLLLNDSGEVWVWGYGILGKGPNLENAVWPQRIPMTLFGLTEFKSNIRVTQIRCGLGSFAAVTNTGELYCWGKNKNGCLGIGSRRDQFFPWKVIIGSEVVDVACGADHMIVLSKSLL